MKKLFTSLLLGTSLFLSACSTQTAYLQKKSPALPTYEDSQSFFFWGIGQEKVVNAVEVCKSEDKIAKVESEWTAPNIILSTITLGIYFPRTARVYCNK